MCSLPVPIWPVCTSSLFQTLTVETHTYTHIHSDPVMEDRIAKSQLLRNSAKSPVIYPASRIHGELV